MKKGIRVSSGSNRVNSHIPIYSRSARGSKERFTTSTMAGRQIFLDVCMGDSQKFLRDRDAYGRARSHLDKHAASYGLPSNPEELMDWQKEILQGIDASQGYETPLRFEPPEPLLAGRLVFELSASPKLAKTTTNFIALCTGEKGACKNASNRKLHYLESPIHRIVQGFIAQGGDILRGDGSGGEVGPSEHGSLISDPISCSLFMEAISKLRKRVSR